MALLTVADQQLEYLWSGPRPDDAPTLVLLHEGLGCAAMWRDVPSVLSAATGCGAVAISRTGYGGSSPVAAAARPVGYLRDEGERVLPRILDTLGVRRAVLIGHSDGGSIALVHAGRPEAQGRVLGVVVAAPHVFVEPISLESIAGAREAWHRGDLRARLQRWHGSNVDCAFLGWNGMWLDPAFAAWSIEDVLPAITVPLLAIQGRDDEYGTLAQIDAIAAGVGGPVETLILDECGHSPHRDQRERTLEAISAFVARVRWA